MLKPFLHDWLAKAAGIPENELTRSRLEAYQLELLKRQIAFAKAKSPFYAGHFAGYNHETLNSLADFAQWPQTTPFDLKDHGNDFLCTSQREVWRIISLQTSGTTGLPKKLFFSENDLYNTVKYFHYSLKVLAKDCKNLMVLMPGNVPGSVGDILRQALEDLPINCHQFGIVTDFAQTLDYIKANAIDFIIGIPAQVLTLCRYSTRHGGLSQIKAVLFGADYISPFCAETVTKLWNCRIIKHYGSTESALGAAVNCPCFTGCHIREAELYFEVVDPVTKQPLPDNKIGEIVISSLNYECMPLLRYNTGDLGAVSIEPCQCGSVLKRLTKMQPRHTILLDDNVKLDINDLDGVLYQFDELVDYEAGIFNNDDGVQVLSIELFTENSLNIKNAAISALQNIPQLKALLAQNKLKIRVNADTNRKPGNPYVLKRRINLYPRSKDTEGSV